MHVGRSSVRETPQPVEPTKPLSERPDAACLGHQTLRIDVGAHFERLRSHNDEVARARSGVPASRHAGAPIQNPVPDVLCFPLPGEAG